MAITPGLSSEGRILSRPFGFASHLPKCSFQSGKEVDFFRPNICTSKVCNFGETLFMAQSLVRPVF